MLEKIKQFSKPKRVKSCIEKKIVFKCWSPNGLLLILIKSCRVSRKKLTTQNITTLAPSHMPALCSWRRNPINFYSVRAASRVWLLADSAMMKIILLLKARQINKAREDGNMAKKVCIGRVIKEITKAWIFVVTFRNRGKESLKIDLERLKSYSGVKIATSDSIMPICWWQSRGWRRKRKNTKNK